MNNERDLHGDVTRVVRSWLREDRHEDADRVLGAALDQVDTTPQRRATPWSAWKEIHMNKFVAVFLGAAAVVVALFIGSRLIGQPNVIGPPAETPSPSAKSSPSEPAAGPQNFGAIPQGTALEPGLYAFTHVDPLRVIVTVPVGWEKGLPNHVIWSLEDDKAELGVDSVDNLYADPCDPLYQLRDPVVGPSVDDLATALGTVPGWEFSAPTDVTIDGFAGQYVEYVSSSPGGQCPQPTLWRGNTAPEPEQPAPTGDDVFRIWILEAGGTRLVVTVGHGPGVLDSRVAEISEMIETMQIEQ